MNTPARHQPLARSLVLVMAVATGLSVASNYYAQPLLPLMRHDLHLSATAAGLLVTVTQAGYALGLVFLLPLGDLLHRRRLTSVMSVLLAGALVLWGVAPGSASLFAAAVATGALSVLAQILVPLAATLAGEADRGRVVGLVMSGLLLGILLARTIAGALAAAGSWRTVYLVAAGLVLVQAAVLARLLPDVPTEVRLGYGRLLASVVALARQEPLLRLRSLYGALSFGAFSVLWTSLAFLLEAAPYHYGPGVIGLFGLIGAAGAIAATAAGRGADRGHSRLLTAGAATLLTACWLLIWLGRTSLAALVAGIVVLDLAAQGMHITNQSEIFRLRPEARSRINSAYMTSYFIGGAAGSAASAAVYSAAGWTGVSVAGASFGGAALLTLAASQLLAGRRRGAQPEAAREA